jgi:hypothetical protein
LVSTIFAVIVCRDKCDQGKENGGFKHDERWMS